MSRSGNGQRIDQEWPRVARAKAGMLDPSSARAAG
jgi:hypothetical protein